MEFSGSRFWLATFVALWCASAASGAPRRARYGLPSASIRAAGVDHAAEPDGLRTTGAGEAGEVTLVWRGLPKRPLRVRLRASRAIGAWRIWDAANSEARVPVGAELWVKPRRGVLALGVEARGSGGAARLEGVRLEADWDAEREHRPGPPGQVQVDVPEIVEREQWGAEPPFEPYDVHAPEALVIHHAYIPDYRSYDRTGGAESVAGIQRFHKHDPTRGWNDIGYHFLIGPDGLIFRARPPTAIGAHAVPNTGKLGICMIGNHDPGGDEPTDDAWRSLTDLVTFLADRYDISVAESLFGHRAFSHKTCPGDLVYGRFDEIRASVWRRLGTMGSREFDE